MKKLFLVRAYCKWTDASILLLRVLCGVAFMLHGWGKIQNPFGWMPGSPIPGFFQALAALSEFGGGIALILGLVFPLASLGLAITMLVAALFHASMGHPFVSMVGGPSFELAAIYCAVFIVLISMGPGRFSLDSKVFGLKS